MLCPGDGPGGEAALQLLPHLVVLHPGGIGIAQQLRPQDLRGRLHVSGDGGVVVGEICVAGTNVYRAQHVPVPAEIEVNSLHPRRRGVGEVDHGDASAGAGRLIHQTAGLAEIIPLRRLTRLGKGDGVHPVAVVQPGEHLAYQHLKGGGGGESASHRDLRIHHGPQSADGDAPGFELSRHAPNEARRGAPLLRPGREVVQCQPDLSEAP